MSDRGGLQVTFHYTRVEGDGGQWVLSVIRGGLQVSTKKQEKDHLNELLQEVMRVEKRYAHEQYGAKNDRRNELKKAVNRIATETERKNGN